MTRTQWRRMQVFALRMVKVSTTPRWQPRLRYFVQDCLERFHGNDSWPFFENWDHSAKDPNWNNQTRELLSDEVKRYVWDRQDCGDFPPYHPEKDSLIEIQLTCCIRAAADVAVAPSAGVYGYTIGDLRKMWHPRSLPKWVSEGYGQDLTALPDTTPICL